MAVIPKVIRSKDVPATRIYTGALSKKLVRLRNVGAKNLQISMVITEPSKSPHSWHTHKGSFIDSGTRRKFPLNCEEFYFVLKGKGKLCWRTNEQESTEDISEGDLIFFPSGVVEHQVINTSTQQLVSLIIMAPPIL